MRWFLFISHLFLFLSLGALSVAEPRQRIMFYNVENLFKPLLSDDSLKVDSTAMDQRGWHYGRYRDKLFHVAQVIMAVGEWNPPMLVGMCEVGSGEVLKDLLSFTSLYQVGYRSLHFESPDRRGSDVALLYRNESFKPLSSHAVRVPLARSEGQFSRDILYVVGEVLNRDTLHIMVCHFPSRRGGDVSSEPNRIKAAAILLALVDSIRTENPQAYILVMGDFNDYPNDRSMAQVLQARPTEAVKHFSANSLYSLCDSLHRKGVYGSYKYQGEWGMLDQFIVSGTLLHTSTKVRVSRQAQLLSLPWLLNQDVTYGGLKPYSTYWGWTYQGGYSDHLPIYIELNYPK